MKIINILFNYKKSLNDNKILGVERCFIDYSKYLILKGNSVVSVTKPKMIFADEVKKTGSRLVEISAFSQIDIFSIIRLATLFLSFNPDAIICHSRRAMFFARAARFLYGKKFPIIAIDHGIRPKKFLKADYVLTVNSFFSKELVAAGKPQDRALVIPNMLEVPKNFVPLVKKPFQKVVRLGSLGRLYPEKFFDKVLRAMAVLRDRGVECEYVIGGIGPMEESLNDLARELGLEKNFRILGWVEDKKTFFDEIDIFLLPSWGETFGIVLLEAMLYSTPIITSNSWGPDEIISDGVDGLKVSKDDEKAMPGLLADAIERLIKDEDFAKRLAAAAYKKFFENYTAEVVTERLNKIIETIVKKERG
jgi:glycosyltransferase involved in cell wall biosynthesis